MGILKTYLDQQRIVPETGDQDWGGEVTDQLVDLLDGANSILHLDGSSNFHFHLESTTVYYTAGATLSPTRPVLKVRGSAAAVTLGGIADGSEDGQTLKLVGQSDTLTVKVPNGLNTRLNGHCTLKQGDVLLLRWDATASVWVEEARTS